ncbi:MAG: DUF5658 family protein [Candidatus Stygibacter frigidus]|nr:DUF5658 family protein [Candidatus Stygibacter frigidus]
MLYKIYKVVLGSIQLPKGLLFSLFLLLVLLNVLDGISTWKVVKRGSNKNEKNPLARFLLNLMGPIPAMIILKGIAIIIILYISINYQDFEPEVHTLMIILNAIYLYIVLHNYKVLRIMKSRRTFSQKI